jgi:hypothetical protein
LFGAVEGVADEFPVDEVFRGVDGKTGESFEAGGCAEECVVIFGDENAGRIWVEAGENWIEDS